MSGVSHHVSVLCCIICVLITASGHYLASKRSDSGVDLAPFKLKKISQELTKNGQKVTLLLNGTHLPKVYRMESYSSEPEQLQVGPEGNVEFFNQDAGFVIILFLHPHGYHILGVFVSNASISEQIVPDVELSLQEGEQEVTFERGNDTDVNITFRVNNNQENIDWLRLYASAFAMKSKTEDHVVERLYSQAERSPFTILGEGRTDSESFTHVRVNTSAGDVEGLLQIAASVLFKCNGDSVCLHEYSVHQDVPVYQNDHAGPFREHFIGLLKSAPQGIKAEKFCSIHHSRGCEILCSVIGDRPSPVEFARVDDGEGRLSPTAVSSLANDGFWAVGQLFFQNFTVGESAEYQCSSRSGSQMVSRRVKVVAISEPRINHALSTVTMLDDGTLEASCVAEGIPAPTLTFYFLNFTKMNDVNSDSYEIIVTPPVGPMSQAVLRIHDPAMANETCSVRCQAMNSQHNHNFTDILSIPLAKCDSDELPASVRYYLENYVVAEAEGGGE